MADMSEVDGFNVTVVYGCGHVERVSQPNGFTGRRIGDWGTCPLHSAAAGYDQRVVEVIREEVQSRVDHT